MAHLNFQIGYMLAIPEAAVKVPITAEDNYYIEGLEFMVGILYFERLGEKTGLRGFPPDPTQNLALWSQKIATGLKFMVTEDSYRLEILDLGIRQYPLSM